MMNDSDIVGFMMDVSSVMYSKTRRRRLKISRINDSLLSVVERVTSC